MNQDQEKEQNNSNENPRAKPDLDKDSFEKLIQLAKFRSISRAYFWGTILGISIGAFFSIAGFVITILGFNGSVEWFVKAPGFTTKLINASPGVFFALLGMLILWRYKPRGRDKLKIGKFTSETEQFFYQFGTVEHLISEKQKKEFEKIYKKLLKKWQDIQKDSSQDRCD